VRRRIVILVYAVAAVFVACRKEAPAPATSTTAVTTGSVAAPPKDLEGVKVDTAIPLTQTVVSKCMPGSQLGPDGAVKQIQTSFGAKDPIHMTIWLNEAPGGLMVGLRALDAKKKEIAYVRAPAEKKKFVTITLDKKLAPGQYLLESYWGGNIVCEHDVDVRR